MSEKSKQDAGLTGVFTDNQCTSASSIDTVIFEALCGLFKKDLIELGALSARGLDADEKDIQRVEIIKSLYRFAEKFDYIIGNTNDISVITECSAMWESALSDVHDTKLRQQIRDKSQTAANFDGGLVVNAYFTNKKDFLDFIEKNQSPDNISRKSNLIVGMINGMLNPNSPFNGAIQQDWNETVASTVADHPELKGKISVFKQTRTAAGLEGPNQVPDGLA